MLHDLSQGLQRILACLRRIESKIPERWRQVYCHCSPWEDSGDRAHLLPCVPITSSGIDVKASLSRLIIGNSKTLSMQMLEQGLDPPFMPARFIVQ
jgi:hypothetical protein